MTGQRRTAIPYKTRNSALLRISRRYLPPTSTNRVSLQRLNHDADKMADMYDRMQKLINTGFELRLKELPDSDDPPMSFVY